jgi:hypothetical protein
MLENNIGVSQRDANYYDYLQKEETQTTICDTIREFWEDEIRLNYAGGEDCGLLPIHLPLTLIKTSDIFDLHLDPKFTTALLLDFAPYRPFTDSLLFDYFDLQSIAQHTTSRLPILRVIDSGSHPSASRNTPAYAESMIPFDLQALGQGRDLGEFREVFAEAVAAGLMDDTDSSTSL